MDRKDKKIKETFKLEVEAPNGITESGVYRVKRTMNGKEDTVKLLIWSDEDIQEMEEYAAEYEEQQRMIR
jgi:hypothetical protein